MADTLTEPQRAWIAALRSGEYKQTTEVLARLDEGGEPVGFCCLGVACDLAAKAGADVDVEEGVYESDEHGDVRCLRFNLQTTWLPEPVRLWLGLDPFIAHNELATLAGMNDAGETFERIADIIESRPEGLFA